MSIKTLIITLCLINNTLFFGQSGIVTYKNTLTPPENLDELKKSNPESYKKANFMLSKMKAYTETLTYTLEFNQVKSKFYTNPALTSDNNKMGSMFFNSTEYYFVQPDNKRFENKEINGTDILVQEVPIKWNISNETKTIKGYKCQKAEAIQLFYSVDRETGKIKTKEQPIEAWFTADIPFPFGPENYGGLPGLILELSTQGNNYSLNNLNIKPDKTTIINFPDTENAISDKEAAKKIYDVYNKMLDW
jgi:GLPGLI family protein